MNRAILSVRYLHARTPIPLAASERFASSHSILAGRSKELPYDDERLKPPPVSSRPTCGSRFKRYRA